MSLIQMTESKFSMWRACIAALWLDGKITEEEMKWAKEKIRLLPFDNEQKTIIENDLTYGLDFAEACGRVSDKVDRAFLLHMLRVLGHLDKDFSAKEKEAYSALEKIIFSKFDLKELASQIEKMELASYHEDEVYKNHNKNSLFENMVNALLRFSNPGNYKLPR